MSHPENLLSWSERMQGARLLLLRLKDRGVRFAYEGTFPKDSKVYTDAEISLAIANHDNMSKYLDNVPILFYDHVRDKKGKLISVKAKFGH